MLRTWRSNPVFTAGDFSLANFTLGTLHVTNNTNLTLSANQVLYLSEDLVIDAGSTLTLTGTLPELHILDADLSELRIADKCGENVFLCSIRSAGVVIIALFAFQELVPTFAS